MTDLPYTDEDLRAEADRQHADEPVASTAPLAAGLPHVHGRCPACGMAGLFLGDGGYITCSSINCPEPDAASTLLERRSEAQHDQTGLRDRIAEALLTTRRTDWEGKADHRRHRFDARCALCAYDVDALADAVLAVLPAPADRVGDVARLQNRILELEADLATVKDLLRTENRRANDAIDREETAEQAALEAQQNRATVLREAADEIAGIDFHPQARVRSLDLAAGLSRRLRRMADEGQPPAAGPRRVQCGDCGALGPVVVGEDGLAYLDPSGQIGHQPQSGAGGVQIFSTGPMADEAQQDGELR